MPKFFGPTATAKPIPKDQVDPFALHRRTTKPVIAVVRDRNSVQGRKDIMKSKTALVTGA